MRLMMLLLFVIINTAVLADTEAVSAAEVTTASIAQASVDGMSQCLHYQVRGKCFWSVCSPLGCYVNTTLRVSHYLPDTVVSVFDRYGNNPWLYANNVIDPIAQKIGALQLVIKTPIPMGSGLQGSNSILDSNNRYKEVDIIGNPALLFFKRFDFLLPSSAIAFQPYYLSLADAYAWRYLGLEKFEWSAYVPGLHTIGVPLIDDWGPLYPRNGFVMQTNDAKAAAVLALRALNITTQTKQFHLYHPLLSHCGDHCQAAIARDNTEEVQFQWVYPHPSLSCLVFGKHEAKHSMVPSSTVLPQSTPFHGVGERVMNSLSTIRQAILPWKSQASVDGKGRYVWLMWRHYEGCLPGYGKYIGAI